jgi:hypothetical protein
MCRTVRLAREHFELFLENGLRITGHDECVLAFFCGPMTAACIWVVEQRLQRQPLDAGRKLGFAVNGPKATLGSQFWQSIGGTTPFWGTARCLSSTHDGRRCWLVHLLSGRVGFKLCAPRSLVLCAPANSGERGNVASTPTTLLGAVGYLRCFLHCRCHLLSRAAVVAVENCGHFCCCSRLFLRPCSNRAAVFGPSSPR